MGVFLSQVGIKRRANCRQRVGAVDLEQSIESQMGFQGI
jgi:hypothetical protein